MRLHLVLGVAAPLAFAVPAMAQVSCNTFNTPSGSITSCSNGQSFNTFNTPGGSITTGNSGDTWNTFNTPGGSITTDNFGDTWNTFNTPSVPPLEGCDDEDGNPAPCE